MGASSFFVDVPASKKERRGEIVVKAITLNGKSYSASVDVQQKKAYWDGTEWNCSGTVKETIEGETIPLNFGISIRGVANNDFSLSGSAAGLESMAKIRIDGEKLVMEYNYNYNDESGMITASGNMIIIFTRTNDSSLSFTLSGKVHASVNGISKGGTLSGSGTGTLVTE